MKVLLPRPVLDEKAKPFFSYSQPKKAGRLEFAVIWKEEFEDDRNQFKGDGDIPIRECYKDKLKDVRYWLERNNSKEEIRTDSAGQRARFQCLISKDTRIEPQDLLDEKTRKEVMLRIQFEIELPEGRVPASYAFPLFAETRLDVDVIKD
jgi:hypothetical protein